MATAISSEYKKDKHPFPQWVNRSSQVMKDHGARHHHEILPNSVLAVEKSSLASATFLPIPAVGPTETLPLPLG
jgi:hypothetical protein